MGGLKQDWLQLLKLAYSFLEHTGIPLTKWSWGGGTALRFYYSHRVSNDIDIFLTDIQQLTHLSPRLNDYIKSRATSYTEMSNWIKIEIQDKEIDFIVAPNLTGLRPKLIKVQGIKLFIDNPVEIVTKKLFYRVESLKMRDLFDLTTVLLKYPKQADVETMSRIVCSKLDILKDRFDFLKKHMKGELKKLEILDTSTAAEIEKIVPLFLKRLENITDRSPGCGFSP